MVMPLGMPRRASNMLCMRLTCTISTMLLKVPAASISRGHRHVFSMAVHSPHHTCCSQKGKAGQIRHAKASLVTMAAGYMQGALPACNAMHVTNAFYTSKAA